jgi:CRISPR-associated endonuclease Cas2
MGYWVIGFDIPSDEVRNRLGKELLKFGIRTQKSFFEIEGDKRTLEIMKKRIKRIMEGEEGVVTLYTVDQKKIERFGDVEYLTVDDLIF